MFKTDAVRISIHFLHDYDINKIRQQNPIGSS